MASKQKIISVPVILAIFIGYGAAIFVSRLNSENNLELSGTENLEIRYLKEKIVALEALNKNSKRLLTKINNNHKIEPQHKSTIEPLLPVEEAPKSIENFEEKEIYTGKKMSVTATADLTKQLNLDSEESKIAAALHAQEIENRFLSEPTDTEWNKKVDSKLVELFKNKYLFGSKITSNNCKTSLCRVVITHKNVEAISMFNKKYRSLFSWPGGSESSSIADKNGNIKTTIYLIR